MWMIGWFTLLCTTFSGHAHVAPLNRGGSETIPGEYLVLTKPDPSLSLNEKLLNINLHMSRTRSNNNLQILARYEFKTFSAFHALATDDDIEVLKSEPSVKLIQENIIISSNDNNWHSEVNLGKCINQTMVETNIWGLTRTSSRKHQSYNSGYYYYDTNGGKDVTAYIIDTGIYLEHEEFEGRAIWGYTAQNLTDEGDVDLDGHGTHVAGTVGGSTAGVAKQVRLIAVKVLGKSGTGSAASIIEGILWTCQHFSTNRQRDKKYKGVVNMSLGSSFNPIQDALISTCTDAGLLFVVASGNENQDACNTSPARVSSVITVRATDQNDTLASFSNYGPCVDILAPGVDVLSAWITDPTSLHAIGGTSMAAPYVTGVVARYLSGQHYNLSPYYIKAWVLDMAAKGDIQIDYNRMTTPNRMLYMPCASEYCRASTCYNGGTCEETEGEFTCSCNKGYEGSQCQTEILVVETGKSHDDAAVVALLSVILVLVILLVIAAFVTLYKKDVFSKLTGKPREEPYRRQDDTPSVSS